jgi:hypothetical protein
MLIQDSGTQKIPSSINFELDLISKVKNKDENDHYHTVLRNNSQTVQANYAPAMLTLQQKYVIV